MVVGICFLLVLLGGIVSLFADNKPHNDDIRTDKKPILTRLTNIGDFEKCVWEADYEGKNTRLSAPDTSTFRIRGYILLYKSEMEKLKKQYKWEEVESDWKPAFQQSILKVDAKNWLRSDEFNNYITPDDYFGEFFIDLNSGILYFDLEL